jgi:uncharacterized membrane protein YqjE
MEQNRLNRGHLAATAKRFARRALTIGENRIELLMVEVQEERVRLVRVILMVFGLVAFGLLAGFTLTGAIVLLCWNHSPVAALLGLSGLYGSVAGILYWRLTRHLRDWQNLPASMDQLRKDRACLKMVLD